MSEPGWALHRDEVIVEQNPRSDARCDEGPNVRAEDGKGRALEVEVESDVQRAARLARLRESIASGAYRISAEAVATKVMKRMRSQPAAEERAAAGMMHTPSRNGNERTAALLKNAERSDS